jgi:hypothetical protein
MAIDGRLHYSGARMNWTTMPARGLYALEDK